MQLHVPTSLLASLNSKETRVHFDLIFEVGEKTVITSTSSYYLFKGISASLTAQTNLFCKLPRLNMKFPCPYKLNKQFLTQRESPARATQTPG